MNGDCWPIFAIREDYGHRTLTNIGVHKTMSEKKTQTNKFEQQIEPLIEKLSNLCEEFGMAMVTSVQLYDDEHTGARTATHITHPKLMSAAMAMSTSLLNGGVEIKVANGVPELIFNVDEFPDEIEPFAFESVDEALAFAETQRVARILPPLKTRKDAVH